MRAILLIAIAAAAAAACGDDDGRSPVAATAGRDQAPPAPLVELVRTELAPAGLDAVVLAPAGAEIAPRFDTVVVRALRYGFRIAIRQGTADFAARRRAIERNTINVLRRWVVDEPQALLYESEVAGRAEYHLIVNTTVGDQSYICEDGKGDIYTLEQAQRMLDACRSLAP